MGRIACSMQRACRFCGPKKKKALSMRRAFILHALQRAYFPQPSFSHPTRAHEAGLSSVFQEFNLLPDRTVDENVHLGREPRRGNPWTWAK